MSSLQNQWVLVTGASRGFGRVLALEFAKAGSHLILTARNAGQLDEVQQQAEQLGVQCATVAGDIIDETVRQAVVQTALEKDVDILVNNAGMVMIVPLEEMPVEKIDREIQLNLVAPIQLTRALLPRFKERRSGTIVNVNSLGGRKPVLHHTIYCATKYGMNGFSESLQMEVEGHGIRIFNVSPGKMDTKLFDAAGKDWDTSAFIPPEEVAAAVVSLLQMSPRCYASELAVQRMK